MISAAGPHSLHLITVANSIGNYTIGLTPHQGSFSFGSNGGIEVYTGGPTVDNCDISSSGLAKLPRRRSHHHAEAIRRRQQPDHQRQWPGHSSIRIVVPQLQFPASQHRHDRIRRCPDDQQPGFPKLGRALRSCNWTPPPCSARPARRINIAQGGTLALTGSTSVAAGVTNAGLIHLSGAMPKGFTGTISNTGSITIDAGATGFFGGPLSGAGAIDNEGVLFFNNTASCGNITGDPALPLWLPMLPSHRPAPPSPRAAD